MLIEALLKSFQSFLEPEFHLLTIKAERSFLRSVAGIPYVVYDTWLCIMINETANLNESKTESIFIKQFTKYSFK